MARITVEDCLKKIDSQYDLVLLAKERTAQLNAGEKSLVSKNNDKNTVIALREIGEGKISIKNIEDLAINKLRKIVKSEPKESEDEDFEHEDDFDKIYKGEISKSGAAILPSKRVRRMPEKMTAPKDEEAEVVTSIDEEVEVKEDTEKNDKETKENSESTENKTE